MIELENIHAMSPNWKTALPHIFKFLERRNLTFQNQLQDGIYLVQHNESGTPFFLVFVFYDKMGIEHLKGFLQLSEETIVRKMIVIFQNTITTNCSKVIENLFQYEIELFKLDNFQYDITKMYYFVPHVKVHSEKDIKYLFDKYGNYLPVLSKSDPIARYYGFKRNDIIKIIRNPDEFIYRIVR